MNHTLFKKVMVLGLLVSLGLNILPQLVATLSESTSKAPLLNQYWWPMHRADHSNTGFSSSLAPKTNRIAWQQTIEGSIEYSSPIVVDNKLYIGINQGNQGYLYCFNSENGTYYWKFSANGVIETSAAISGYTVFFAATNHADNEAMVYCINITTQTVEWTQPIDDVACCSPILFSEKLYICSNVGNRGKIYCFDQVTGTKIWDKIMDTGWIMPYNCTPAMWTTAHEKTVYFLTMEETGDHVTQLFRVYAENGSIDWNKIVGKSFSVSVPSLMTISGRVYLGAIDQTGDTNIYCYESDGSQVWNEVLLEGEVLYSSSPATDGIYLYVVAQDFVLEQAHLYCFVAQTGKKAYVPALFSTKVVTSGVAISGLMDFGFVGVGAARGTLYCLTTSTGDVVWTYEMNDEIFSSPTIANQRVYIASRSGTITAFGDIPSIGKFSGGFLKVNVEVMNVGGDDFTNLTWKIAVDGGLLGRIHHESTGTILLLEANKTANICVSRIFGLGKIQINATVTTGEHASVSRTREGFIFGPFVILK